MQLGQRDERSSHDGQLYKSDFIGETFLWKKFGNTVLRIKYRSPPEDILPRLNEGLRVKFNGFHTQTFQKP